MSPEQKDTVEAFQMEYSRLATQAGDLGYRIYAMSKDLADVQAKMLEINLKAGALKQAESK